MFPIAFLAILFLQPVVCSADQISAQESPLVQVQQVDPSFPIGKMGGQGIQLHAVTSTASPQPIPDMILKRDLYLKMAGLQADVQTWDSFEKDRLIIRAKTVQPDRLRELYPKLDTRKLGKLHAILRNES